MFGTRIDRYIIREVTSPTLLGLAIFTFVLLVGRILKLAEMVINKGVPADDILRLFIYLLPTFLVITIPLSFLLGILLGFGRLSADSEVTALKASGVSLYRMLLPVLAPALLACLLTAGLTLYAEPAGHSAFRNQVFQIASSRASVGIEPRVFNDEFDGLVIYADSVDEATNSMTGLFISEDRVASSPSMIFARSGRIISNGERLTLTLRLLDGSIHRRPKDDSGATYQVIEFANYDINLNLGEQLATPQSRRKKPKELSLAELRQAESLATSAADRRSFNAAIHKRFVLPLAPLLFALVGVPLGIQNTRSGRGGGFATGLILFLIYYMSLSFAETLAVEGGLPAALCLWAPTLLFISAGAYLLHLTAMERPLPLLERLSTAAARLRWRPRRPE